MDWAPDRTLAISDFIKDLRGCMQAPMAFAGSHASKDESQIVQPPIAFSGRSRTHRLVEVRQIVSNVVVCRCLKTAVACV